MLGLHLFNSLEYDKFYDPLLYIGKYPLIYYISFLFDSCVPIYCFCSGYALYLKNATSINDNIKRIIKFLKRYWLVLFLTSFIGILLKNEKIPGSFFDFLENFFLIDITYVGAWWFVKTYVLLIIVTPLIIKIVNRFEKQFCLLTVIVYFVAYYFKIINPIQTDIHLLDSMINTVLQFGISLLPFVYGMVFYKNLLISRVKSIFVENNIFAFIIVFISVILHVLIKSVIIAPFIAILFIIGFSLMNFNLFIKKILLFLGKHSTNIWLVHMQFYMIFFPGVVFYTHTTFGCFFILLLLSLLSSYIIYFIEKLYIKFKKIIS